MILVRAVAWDDPDAERLRAAQRLEINGRYGRDAEQGPKPSAADTVVVVVASVDGVAAGTGALRPLGPASGEIKRMFVDPAHRGTGVADAVLAALEDEARARGWTHLRLETGDLLHEANRFYSRSGYRAIPAFGHYVGDPTSVCYEKTLLPQGADA
ncbi:MAG: GNAT family N-acetyltransferase [Jatrophihabitans sp.]|uniref:GNAT family N-acetyltransferase n=1 Tax=Jatrophihabitans sp. TaxID=1932789 RepID=UPI003F81F1EE